MFFCMLELINHELDYLLRCLKHDNSQIYFNSIFDEKLFICDQVYFLLNIFHVKNF